MSCYDGGMSEVFGDEELQRTYAMQELGINDMFISLPGMYHEPVVRMYAGSSTPQEANKIYRTLHEQRMGDRTNLSIAFDLVSQNGANPFEEGRAEIGKVGTALYDAHDMQTALNGIPLAETSTSMTINGTAAFELACYIVAAEVTGVPKDKLRGIVQNDILKEHFRNTVSADLEAAFRIECDIIEYCGAQKNVPGWFGVSASGYHMAEAGASAAREVGITQANAEAVLNHLLDRGHSVEDVARRMSFFYVTRPDNFMEETAKLRAARIIWANRIRNRFHCDDPQSQKMRIHVHTAGEAMPRQYVESGTLLAGHSALSAQLAPAQSLHVVGFREALSIPDERERTIGMYTPDLQKDVVESLRNIIDTSPEFLEMVYRHVGEAARVLLEIENAGGSINALREGIPQRMIAEDFVRREQDKTTGELPVLGRSIGVRDPQDSSVDVPAPDARFVDDYLRDLTERMSGRDPEYIQQCITAIGQVAAEGSNIMPITLEAVRGGVTIWEWNDAIRRAVGYDHRPLLLESEDRIMSAFAELEEQKQKVEALFVERIPRILVSKAGLDGHDKGAKVVIKIAEGCGFDVIQGNYRATPADIARQAVMGEVDVIAISILSGSHIEQAREISAALDAEGDTHIGLIFGGIIPSKDIKTLLEMPRVKVVVDSQDDPTPAQVGESIIDAAVKTMFAQ